ncbi:zinc-containing alcohol dehydrogenase [Xylaria acuta]|nr:zinc-containing alcohol dehydrogenase [Xylaria acuta]
MPRGPKVSSTEQTVFRLTAFDGFDNLQPCREHIPTPSAGEVLTVAIAKSMYPFAVKDNVIPVFRRGQASSAEERVLHEYIAIPAHVLIKLPPCKTPRGFVQWAATPCAVSTVWNAFYGNARLKPGGAVLVLVLGTGGVSVTALILAKAAGATTIVTSSSDKKLDFTTPDWAAEVQRITNGKGVDHVIEVGGPGTMHQSLAAAGRGGTPEDQIPDLTMMALTKRLVVRGVMGGSEQQLEEAVRFISARGLEIPVDKVFAFERDGIIAALNYV